MADDDPFVLTDEMRALMNELHDESEAAAATINTDPQTWLEHAARASEIYDELAQRFGWKEAEGRA